VRLGLHVVFFIIMTVELGVFPLHLLRELLINIIRIKQLITVYFKYCKILQSLETKFRTVRIPEDGERDAVCTVCMVDITVGKQLPCGHIFHLECLKEWFRRNPICPTCRHVIDVNSMPVINQQPNAPEIVPEVVPNQPEHPMLNTTEQHPKEAVELTGLLQNQGVAVHPAACFVIPSPALHDGQEIRTLENYSLAVQRQVELHEAYISHLYSLQHNLLAMQGRWKKEDVDKAMMVEHSDKNDIQEWKTNLEAVGVKQYLESSGELKVAEIVSNDVGSTTISSQVLESSIQDINGQDPNNKPKKIRNESEKARIIREKRLKHLVIKDISSVVKERKEG